MGIMVDLEKVKEIVKKHGKYIEGLFTELDRLAYGKTWECLNCGKQIYFGDVFEAKYYLHIGHGGVRCAGGSGHMYMKDIAIPKPEENYTPIGEHEDCLYCGKRIYFGGDEWYHFITTRCKCETGQHMMASLHRAKPKPKEMED